MNKELYHLTRTSRKLKVDDQKEDIYLARKYDIGNDVFNDDGRSPRLNATYGRLRSAWNDLPSPKYVVFDRFGDSEKVYTGWPRGEYNAPRIESFGIPSAVTFVGYLRLNGRSLWLDRRYVQVKTCSSLEEAQLLKKQLERLIPDQLTMQLGFVPEFGLQLTVLYENPKYGVVIKMALS